MKSLGKDDDDSIESNLRVVSCINGGIWNTAEFFNCEVSSFLVYWWRIVLLKLTLGLIIRDVWLVWINLSLLKSEQFCGRMTTKVIKIKNYVRGSLWSWTSNFKILRKISEKFGSILISEVIEIKKSGNKKFAEHDYFYKTISGLISGEEKNLSTVNKDCKVEFIMK